MKYIVHSLYCILLSLFLYSCQIQKNNSNIKVSHTNIDLEINHFVDSLKHVQNVDRILILKKGCSGCIEKINSFGYIYWEKNGIKRVKKIVSQGEGYNIQVKYDLLSEETPVQKVFDQNLVKSDFLFSHFKYTDLRIIEGAYDRNIRIEENQFEINKANMLVRFVLDIESKLFYIENDW